MTQKPEDLPENMKRVMREPGVVDQEVFRTAAEGAGAMGMRAGSAAIKDGTIAAAELIAHSNVTRVFMAIRSSCWMLQANYAALSRQMKLPEYFLHNLLMNPGVISQGGVGQYVSKVLEADPMRPKDMSTVLKIPHKSKRHFFIDANGSRWHSEVFRSAMPGGDLESIRLQTVFGNRIMGAAWEVAGALRAAHWTCWATTTARMIFCSCWEYFTPSFSPPAPWKWFALDRNTNQAQRLNSCLDRHGSRSKLPTASGAFLKALGVPQRGIWSRMLEPGLRPIP